MESARFDDVLRALASGRSRRAAIGAALGSLIGASSLVILGDEVAAKKKHGKKNRKKCKGGTKKCGKKCIPATGCCSSSECGNGGACINGACNCLSGFKSCDGACIAEDQCCGGCPGTQTCENGSCVCPGIGLACPDGSCPTGFECCTNADCSGVQICDDGVCLCPESDDIFCGENCCQAADDEVCDATAGIDTCQGGGCPTTDWCNSDDVFFCANGCVCLSTADTVPQHACVVRTDVEFNLDCADSCTDSDDCPSGSVCVPGDSPEGGFCNCANNFCAQLCDSASDRHANRHSRSLTAAKVSPARKHRS